MNAILPSGSCMMLLRLMSLLSPVILLGENSIFSVDVREYVATGWRSISIDTRISLQRAGIAD